MNKNSSFFRKVSILALLMVLVFQLFTCTHVYANGFSEESRISESLTESTSLEEAEELEYHYATDPEGQVWYRIWSLTYGRWKTDWILIG